MHERSPLVLSIAVLAATVAGALPAAAQEPASELKGDPMAGALGHYSMTREASGTAWQPDMSGHAGIHIVSGDWLYMVHALINDFHSDQSGPRGDAGTYVSGMLMGMAKRPFDDGDVLQLRGMISPDPFMGRRGYPLLLASGETADGTTALVDRQHPHDMIMEMSASYSHRLDDTDSAYIYAGLPGEPAFGPPAFMHRLSIMDSPEAPISHHWLDSGHITFGVVTAGYIHNNWKLEASRFRGREPDQNRWNIETGALDSTAVRASWNPTASLALQASWADVKSPEQLEPDENQRRWSASAIYSGYVGDGRWSTTLAWGRRSSGADYLNAWALEGAIKPDDAWTVFARAEWTQNNELTMVAGHAGPIYQVSKQSLGVIHDWKVAEHARFGLGGLYALDQVPAALRTAYGDNPHGTMAFVRLKVE